MACAICRALGEETWWGESIGTPIPDRPPSEMRALEIVSETLARCPLCGNLYERGDDTESFLNADYESHYLRRFRPSEYPTDAERAAAMVRTRADLRDADVEVRAAAAKLLTREAGHDLGELLTNDAPIVRRIAIEWLQQNRSTNVLVAAMLDDDDPSIRTAAAEIVIRHSQELLHDLAVMLEHRHPEVRLAGLEGVHAQTVKVFETRLRSMMQEDDSPRIRREAASILTAGLLRTSRRAEAEAILDAAAGDALTGAFEAFVSVEPERLMELLPRVRTALRSDSREGAHRALLSMMEREDSRLPALRAVAAWQQEGDAVPLSKEIMDRLVAWLADDDRETRRMVRRILTRRAEQGAAIASRLSLIGTKLGSSATTAPELITEAIRDDRDLEPILVWIDLLTYQKPDEALSLLNDLVDRGQDISIATDSLARLAKRPRTKIGRAAQGLLDRLDSPQIHEDALAFENIRAGHLTLYGTDRQGIMWLIYADRGGFVIEHWFGDHGDPQPISAGRVRSIVARKAYARQEVRR